MKSFTSAIFAIIVVIAAIGCGVKGDPVPPEKAPELGRGQPSYQKATRGIRVRPESIGLAPAGGTYYNEDDEDSDEDEDQIKNVRPKKNSAQEETR